MAREFSYNTVLKSILIWTAVTFLTALLFIVMLCLAVLLFPFDKKRAFLHSQCYWWSDAVINVNPLWRVQVHGLENIDKKQTYVIVANHRSIADIAVLYQTRMQFKWVAKESLFKVPLIGWCLYLARHIKLARGRNESIKQLYREAETWLRNDMSVLFFPEGTRSRTGKMMAFHNGAFKLAVKEKIAVLPIAIKGTADAMPKGKWIFGLKANIRMTVLPAIEIKTFQPADFARLSDIARAMIEAA